MPTISGTSLPTSSDPSLFQTDAHQEGDFPGATRRDDMELLHAGVQIEPFALYQTSIDGEAICTFVAIEQPEPGNARLADFTLAVIKDASAISHDPLSL